MLFYADFIPLKKNLVYRLVWRAMFGHWDVYCTTWCTAELHSSTYVMTSLSCRLLLTPTSLSTTRIYQTNISWTWWGYVVSYMSHLMTKPTKWHVSPAKRQISLGIRRCPGWSESSLVKALTGPYECGGGGRGGCHFATGQIISNSCSCSSETEFTPLVLASKSEFS